MLRKLSVEIDPGYFSQTGFSQIQTCPNPASTGEAASPKPGLPRDKQDEIRLTLIAALYRSKDDRGASYGRSPSVFHSLLICETDIIVTPGRPWAEFGTAGMGRDQQNAS